MRPLAAISMVTCIAACTGSGSETGNPFDEGMGGFAGGVLPGCGSDELEGADALETIIEGFDFSGSALVGLVGSRSSTVEWASNPLAAASGSIVLSPQGQTTLTWSVEPTGTVRVFRGDAATPDCVDHVDVDVTLTLDSDDGAFSSTQIPAILSSEDGQSATLSAYFGLIDVRGSFDVQPPPDAMIQLLTLDIDLDANTDAGRLWAFVEPTTPGAPDTEEITLATW